MSKDYGCCDDVCDYAGALRSFLGNLTDRCDCICHEWVQCDEDDSDDLRRRW